MFEEQQHRQINYSFGLTGKHFCCSYSNFIFLGTKAESTDFSLNLRQLTGSSNAEDYISPVIIDEEPVSIEITKINKLFLATSIRATFEHYGKGRSS
jgi:hypothetical protein